jgi:hypothetical protein
MDIKELKKLINEEVNKRNQQKILEQTTVPGRKRPIDPEKTGKISPEEINTANIPGIGSKTVGDRLKAIAAASQSKTGQSSNLNNDDGFDSFMGGPGEESDEDYSNEGPLVGSAEEEEMKKQYRNKPGFTFEEWKAKYPNLTDQEVLIKREEALEKWANEQEQKAYDQYFKNTGKPHPDDAERIKAMRGNLEVTPLPPHRARQKPQQPEKPEQTEKTSQGYVNKILDRFRGIKKNLGPNDPTVTNENKHIQQESKIKIRIK